MIFVGICFTPILGADYRFPDEHVFVNMGGQKRHHLSLCLGSLKYSSFVSEQHSRQWKTKARRNVSLPINGSMGRTVYSPTFTMNINPKCR